MAKAADPFTSPNVVLTTGLGVVAGVVAGISFSDMGFWVAIGTSMGAATGYVLEWLKSSSRQEK